MTRRLAAAPGEPCDRALRGDGRPLQAQAPAGALQSPLRRAHARGLPRDRRLPPSERALRRGVPQAGARRRRGAGHAQGVRARVGTSSSPASPFAPADADDPDRAGSGRRGGRAGDRRRAAPHLPPRDPAGGLPRASWRCSARPASPSGRASSSRSRSAPISQRRGAQRRRARGVRRGRRLPDRPLPRQGVCREHPRPALRERPLRADLEQRPRRPRPDRRARDADGRGPLRLLRADRRLPRHGRHAPLPGARLHRHGAPHLAHREGRAERDRRRCSTR